jgi:hypothetical protein
MIQFAEDSGHNFAATGERARAGLRYDLRRDVAGHSRGSFLVRFGVRAGEVLPARSYLVVGKDARIGWKDSPSWMRELDHA